MYVYVSTQLLKLGMGYYHYQLLDVRFFNRWKGKTYGFGNGNNRFSCERQMEMAGLECVVSYKIRIGGCVRIDLGGDF